MKVTTKIGDAGQSCLPTVGGGGKISKGFLAFEVLGKIDQLDHDIQVAMLCLSEYKGPIPTNILNELYDHLNCGVRILYSTLLCDQEADYKDKYARLVSKLEEHGARMEKAYFGVTGKEMEADFSVILTSFPSLTVNQCRVSCRALERCLVQQMDMQAFEQKGGKVLYYQDAVLPFVNRFSDWLYEASLLLDALYAKTH